jgi:hypothetical protein
MLMLFIPKDCAICETSGDWYHEEEEHVVQFFNQHVASAWACFLIFGISPKTCFQVTTDK